MFYSYQIIINITVMEMAKTYEISPQTEKEMSKQFERANSFIKWLMVFACFQYLLGMALLGLL